jgi:aldose sugar dehydrogenase
MEPKVYGHANLWPKINIALTPSILASVLTCLTLSLIEYEPHNAYAQSVKDPNLAVESFVEGLSSPTSMAFMDDNNILVLEKDGNVRLVSNGQLQAQPVLQIPVDTENERGLLGIAVLKSSSTSSVQGANATQTVFLYYTESGGAAGELRNRVYKYSWNGQTLSNPTLILDLPAIPGPNHNAGKLMIGPDNYLYGMIGDLNHDGKLQNFPDGPDPDDTGIIFRVNPNDGSPAPNNPLATNDPSNPLSKYYAYGVRNSFGLTFDPVSGNIWDTENGPSSNDEINLVRPGFNSGWQTVMGPIAASGSTEAQLVNFPGSHYADPILTWSEPNAVTDIEFLESSSLGENYSNNAFVGDNNFGNLYNFKMNPERSSFILDNIPDSVVDTEQEQSSIVFGNGFGAITDLETGPGDGYLYVLSYDNGIIYKIAPASSVTTPTAPVTDARQEDGGGGEAITDEQQEDGGGGDGDGNTDE